MDIMSRVFLVNEVRLYPPSERRKLIYIHSKLVTSIEADFTHECKIFIAGLGGVEEECRFAWDSNAHQYRMIDKWNQFSMIPVFQSYAEARNCRIPGTKDNQETAKSTNVESKGVKLWT